MIFNFSAVLRKAGNCSWATFTWLMNVSMAKHDKGKFLTSPAYMNSRMAVRCAKGTSWILKVYFKGTPSTLRVSQISKIVTLKPFRWALLSNQII